MREYKIRKQRFPQGYPQSGTLSALVLECLEAEPATCEEIAEYLGTTPNRAGALAIVLMNEHRLIKRISKGRYQLINPELVSRVYGSLENDAQTLG